uniref:Malic enzyme n=1 Tax=Glossina brevipalpis TaxID=37001 RepID=A0A1A9X044_9MUSC
MGIQYFQLLEMYYQNLRQLLVVHRCLRIGINPSDINPLAEIISNRQLPYQRKRQQLYYRLLPKYNQHYRQPIENVGKLQLISGDKAFIRTSKAVGNQGINISVNSTNKFSYSLAIKRACELFSSCYENTGTAAITALRLLPKKIHTTTARVERELWTNKKCWRVSTSGTSNVSKKVWTLYSDKYTTQSNNIMKQQYLKTKSETIKKQKSYGKANTKSFKLSILAQNIRKAFSETLDTVPLFKQTHGLFKGSALKYQQRFNYTKDCDGDQSDDRQLAPRDRMGFWGTGGGDIPGKICGIGRLRNKKYNKGLGFNFTERQLLGIHGLLPCVYEDDKKQIARCVALLDTFEKPLHKFMYLYTLSENNERLFFKVFASNIPKILPLVYTPVVGLACQNYSMIYSHHKGLFISIKDKGHVYDVLKNYPENAIRAIVVTDGERILGLGDLGANGMGIPIGKLALYVGLAGFKPEHCLPITLDVGTNNDTLLKDPLYIGLRQKRPKCEIFEEFIEEFMQAVVRRFGQNCLIQFEDFGNFNAFGLLAKYRDHYCTFNDDIQGTASVGAAGLLASTRIKGDKLSGKKFLFFGAGEACLGLANLLIKVMVEEGVSEADAKKLIWMFDSKGLIVKNRPKGGLTEYKEVFAQDHAPVDKLLDAVKTIKPAVLIGGSTIGGAFTPEILGLMAEYNETPIIFALSNPTHKAECTAEQAYTATKGKCLFASGSPFNPVKYNGKTYHTGQCNNSYCFPGIALGVVCSGMLTVPEDIFYITAQKLADLCDVEQDLKVGRLYPPLEKITTISLEIATHVMQYAFDNCLATLHPEPENKKEYIKNQMYKLDYPSAVPKTFDIKTK